MNAPTTFKWVHDSFGSNFRLGDIEASMVRPQLASLEHTHARRTHNALRLAEGLADVAGITVPLPPAGLVHAFYRLYAYAEPERLSPGWDRDRIVRAINAEGVPCQYGVCAELYREQAFADAGLGPAERLPGAMRADRTSLAFFVHPTVEDADIHDAIAATRKVMEVAAG